MKYYLAGPMAGMPDCGYPVFADASKWLRDLGYDIVSPHEIQEPADVPEGEWSPEAVRLDIQDGLIHCGAIILLPGWTRSKGSIVEFNLAMGLGMEVYFFQPRTGMLTRMDRPDVEWV